jgi:hypothetical protein
MQPFRPVILLPSSVMQKDLPCRVVHGCTFLVCPVMWCGGNNREACFIEPEHYQCYLVQ